MRSHTERNHKGVGAEKDMLLILYTISVVQVTRRGSTVSCHAESILLQTK